MPLICADCKKEKTELVVSACEDMPVQRCDTCHFAAVMKFGWAKDPIALEAEEKRKLEAFARLKALKEAKKKLREEAKNT